MVTAKANTLSHSEQFFPERSLQDFLLPSALSFMTSVMIWRFLFSCPSSLQILHVRFASTLSVKFLPI